jgi:hypothetical protein
LQDSPLIPASTDAGNLGKMTAVFNRLKGGDREKGPEYRRCSGDGSRSEGYDRLTGVLHPTATA